MVGSIDEPGKFLWCSASSEAMALTALVSEIFVLLLDAC